MKIYVLLKDREKLQIFITKNETFLRWTKNMENGNVTELPRQPSEGGGTFAKETEVPTTLSLQGNWRRS